MLTRLTHQSAPFACFAEAENLSYGYPSSAFLPGNRSTRARYLGIRYSMMMLHVFLIGHETAESVQFLVRVAIKLVRKFALKGGAPAQWLQAHGASDRGGEDRAGDQHDHAVTEAGAVAFAAGAGSRRGRRGRP